MVRPGFPSKPVSPAPLRGDAGLLIHKSSCGRYEIRRVSMVLFIAEAIVNTTNSHMTANTVLEPGTRLQILAASGQELRHYLRNVRPDGLYVGDAVASQSFNMRSCYYLIHTHGPNHNTMPKGYRPLFRQLLADCYRRCLEEAFRIKAASIAFPCISAGYTCGWPRLEASKIALNVVTAWFKHPIHGFKRRNTIHRVSFLADPQGLSQERAWIVAFNGMWPGAPAPEPPLRPFTPNNEGHEPDVQFEMNRLGESQADSVKPRQIPRRGMIGQRELSSLGITLQDTVSVEVIDVRRSSSRVRRKPRWYGQ